VVFYYVNDADGDTVFFDQNHQVMKSVSPKKGRLIIFDGTLYHGGGIPKKGPRCAINFNILTTKPK
jgi:ectoine hydroxylase-related dioxygenase (phytanoyl-CoA dioxygenase family)